MSEEASLDSLLEQLGRAEQDDVARDAGQHILDLVNLTRQGQASSETALNRLLTQAFQAKVENERS
jgi:hypothetical protein